MTVHCCLGPGVLFFLILIFLFDPVVFSIFLSFCLSQTCFYLIISLFNTYLSACLSQTYHELDELIFLD